MKAPLTSRARHAIESGHARLPVFPSVAVRAQLMLSDAKAELEDVETLFASDPALAAALLRAANSAAFGAVEEATTIREAAVRLGMRRTCQLAIVFSQHRSYAMGCPGLRPIAESVWRHATACAIGTDWLARQIGRRDVEPHAMLAGLLHDVGKLFLLDLIDALLAESSASSVSDQEVTALLQEWHCEQGDRLLQHWGIPATLCAIARRHHDLEVDPGDALLLLVRIVDRAWHRMTLPASETDADASDPEAEMLGISPADLDELRHLLEESTQIVS